MLSRIGLAPIVWTVVLGFLAWGSSARGSDAVEMRTAVHYPSGLVRIVVGFTPGGPTDLLARELASRLQAAWGKPVVVENRPGASSRVAFEHVARAKPDGHTLLLGSVQTATLMATHRHLGFDTLRDFAPVTQLTSASLVLAASPSLGAVSLADALALARTRPGTLSYASFGVASSSHFAGALLEQRAGVKLIHVPFSGAGPAEAAIAGGQVDLGFVSVLSATPLLSSGRLRPLAVAAERRLPQFPDVPTLSEAGLADFSVSSWQGLLAPRATPQPIIAKLHRDTAQALETPEVRDRLRAVAVEPVGSTPAQFRALIESEIKRWSGVARHIGLSLD